MGSNVREVLDSVGIIYTEKNNGVHLVVEGGEGFIDYWPTTGKWKCRSSNEYKFGLNALVDYVFKSSGEVQNDNH